MNIKIRRIVDRLNGDVGTGHGGITTGVGHLVGKWVRTKIVIVRGVAEGTDICVKAQGSIADVILQGNLGRGIAQIVKTITVVLPDIVVEDFAFQDGVIIVGEIR